MKSRIANKYLRGLSPEQLMEVDEVKGRIFQEIDNHHQSLINPSSRPHAHVVVGGPGSGKSTIIQKLLQNRPEFYTLDKDEAKKQFKEYDPKAPHIVHDRSTEVFNKAQQYAINKKVPLVIETTAAHPQRFVELLDSLRDRGYKIKVHGAFVDLDTALERNRQRERSVPEHIVRKLYDYIAMDNPFAQVLPKERGRMIHTRNAPIQANLIAKIVYSYLKKKS